MKTTDGWRCQHELHDSGQVHYCTYIGLESLLALTVPFPGTDQARAFIHDDEPQFQVVHQMIELGFANHIWTLARTIELIDDGEFTRAEAFVQRMIAWCSVYGNVMKVFATMRKENFDELVEHLVPASGAESEQHRIIELLSGLEPDDPYVNERGKDYTFREFLDRPPGPDKREPKTRWWTPRLNEIAAGPTVRKSIRKALAARSIAIGNAQTEEVQREHPALVSLLGALVRYDKAFRAFRTVHVGVGRQQVGARPGSGHTSGVPYLASVAETARFYPELW